MLVSCSYYVVDYYVVDPFSLQLIIYWSNRKKNFSSSFLWQSHRDGKKKKHSWKKEKIKKKESKYHNIKRTSYLNFLNLQTRHSNFPRLVRTSGPVQYIAREWWVVADRRLQISNNLQPFKKAKRKISFASRIDEQRQDVKLFNLQ